MVIKYAFFVCFLLCHISGIDNKDFHNEFTSQLSKYSIVHPQVIERGKRSVDRLTESQQKDGEETILYSLNINDRHLLLRLTQNRDFLHPNLINSSLRRHVHCYYHGEVEGYDNSMVALSTCSGLRGVIMLDNETYGLEPLPRSATNDHILYLLKDVQTEPVTCGVLSEAESVQNHEAFDPGHSLTSLLRRRRNLPQASYVELALIADNLRYNLLEKNETAVREELVEMANLLDSYYKPLNIRVVLVALEIFKDSNPFSVDGTAGDVLRNFVQWRKSVLIPKIRHDIGQLIVGQPRTYEGGVLGMAFVGTVCSVATSGGINVIYKCSSFSDARNKTGSRVKQFSNKNLPFISTVVAHEMGHNLGMNHDDGCSSCDAKSCIMSAGASGSTTFSSCSGQDFERLVLRGGGVCLRNEPSPSDVIGTAECGNGRVDKGEDCDCGKPEECKTKCCDPATCRFTVGSACAHGECCDRCQIRVSGTPCRKSVNACDLPEYCDGKGAFCPNDFYIMDGLSCENDAAYCYEGRCQTYDSQCRHLFAPDPATKAADTCFTHANVQGNLFGNCGIISNGKYIKCAVEHAMCGKVQCTNVDVNNPPPGAHVSIQVVNGSTCVNADFNLGTDVLDPAYVNSGSPCSAGKTCVDFKCVNASVLLPNLDCNAETTCNDRGSCNDQGHCHCANGWAPPNCAKAGRGGSIDSGPAQIDYSLRDGLLIFFLLVVPLLVLVILVLLYFFRRSAFDPCLKKGRSSNGKNGNANGQPNRNVETGPGNQPPVHSPPVPGNSADTSPPSDRYGDLDYWNIDESIVTKQPAVPRQGPGVPKPIPSKQPHE